LVLTLKRQVAAELGVPLVDTTPLLEGPAAKALYLEADPVHLNKQGNEKVAQALVSALEPLVP
jgi:lysophospholipase L1-like esterase